MIRSMGSGKMIVEFFSAEMEFSVCKRGGHGSISTGTESDKSNASKGASIYNVHTEEGGGQKMLQLCRQTVQKFCGQRGRGSDNPKMLWTSYMEALSMPLKNFLSADPRQNTTLAPPRPSTLLATKRGQRLRE